MHWSYEPEVAGSIPAISIHFSVAFERHLCRWLSVPQDLNLALLKPDVKGRVEPRSDICEGDSLVDSVLEKRDIPIPCVVEDPDSCLYLLALAAIAKNGARLLPLRVDRDQLLRPHIPVD